MQNNIKIAIGFVAGLVVGILVVVVLGPNKQISLGGYSNPVPVVKTDSSVTLQTATTTVLAANPNRSYALITNDSDTVIYLHLNEATTTNALNAGIRLNANGGSFEIDESNLYTGEISATSTVAGKILTVVEF